MSGALPTYPSVIPLSHTFYLIGTSQDHCG
jgi:hypothetical protein